MMKWIRQPTYIQVAYLPDLLSRGVSGYTRSILGIFAIYYHPLDWIYTEVLGANIYLGG